MHEQQASRAFSIQHAKLSTMTTFYRAGSPLKTEAVVYDLSEIQFSQCENLPPFTLEHELSRWQRTVLKLPLQEHDKVFGLGACLGTLNKRGKKYILFNTDDSLHTPDKESLYGSHPFMIIDGSQHLGLFIDFPGKIIFDIGFTERDMLKITIDSPDFDLYLFDSGSKQEIFKEYLQLVGAPYLPPKWAFGYQQSRWSYHNRKVVEELAANLRTHEIPCDVIYFDIDYMQDYKVFTINEERFPQVAELLQHLLRQGFKVVPIIDPGVKLAEQYDICREGKENRYFCQDKKGHDFVGAVWPGLALYPDFFNRKTRDWWTGHCKIFLKMGFSGFWNDMNEPAIFYTPGELDKCISFIKEQKNTMTLDEFFHIRGAFKQLANREEYYRQLYHITDGGKKINHYPVHNLYGYYMAKATTAATSATDIDTDIDSDIDIKSRKRLFLLSRSNYVGLHRISAIWTGDNHSWWEHMFQNIQMLMSLNMVGFLFVGADIGGFGGNTSSELLIRWTQLGVFNPLFRNHSALGTRNQEPFAFDQATTGIIKRTIEFRYALLPYIYSEMLSSIIHLTPLIRPLCFEFKDKISADIEDQFLFGQSVLAAPVHKANGRARFVYLPEVRWLLWRVSDYRQRQCEVLSPGMHYLPARLDEMLLLIRENSMLVLTSHQQYVGEKELTELTLIAFIKDKAHYTYYEDDGVTTAYQQGNYSTIEFTIEKTGRDYLINYEVKACSAVPLTVREFNFEIYDDSGQVFRKRLAR